VRNAADSAGLQTPRFVTANPLVAGFANLEWTDGALYYARDDWLSSPARRKYWPAYREAYRRIAERGHAVAAVSQEIIDRIGPTGPHRVVPNGIEPDEWLGAQPEAPDWFARIPGPRAVYVGTLDSRLDLEGLRALAGARPDLHIVLIGPAPDPSYVAPLRSLPNVHIRGLVGRREVVAVLRNSELTLLAHRRTPLTEAMSPLKVYEYLAAGRPVLATDLRPVHDLGPRVLLSETVEEFADLIDTALAQGVQSEPERQEFVRANAWPSRHREILSLLEGSG
jgi:teichuronic acid biosynthesis glycosyltransferase TuaH